MSARLRELSARRDALIVEAQRQRETLALSSSVIRQRTALADRAFTLVRTLQRKPLILTAGAIALALLTSRPTRAVKWVGYLWSSYPLLLSLLRLFARRSQHE